MLVLTRKLGEKVVVGGNVTITVTAIHGNKVRLGIEAPEDVEIWREELLEEAPVQVQDEPVCPRKG